MALLDRMKWLLHILVPLSALAGCADLGSGVKGQGGSGGIGGAAGAGGDSGSGGDSTIQPTVPLAFTVSDWTTRDPLEGVEICEADSENCAITNSDGRAILDLERDQDIALTLEKEGYGPLLGADRTDETFVGASIDFMYRDETLRAIADDLGVAYPWDGGVVRFARNPNSLAGTTFQPAGETVGIVGEPYYYDIDTGRYGYELDASTGPAEPWFIPLSEGGFVEVPPGVREFEFGGTAGDCEPRWGWPGEGPNRVRVPVRDGYIVYGAMNCE